jgi:hypothetical protein
MRARDRHGQSKRPLINLQIPLVIMLIQYALETIVKVCSLCFNIRTIMSFVYKFKDEF